jgi:glucose dehydrogenase
MSGTKSVGQVLCDSSHTSIGNYDPQETNINFAVPNTHTIINYTSMEICLRNVTKSASISSFRSRVTIFGIILTSSSTTFPVSQILADFVTFLRQISIK